MYDINKYLKLYKIVIDNKDFMHLNKKTIFVTGATGFLGMWLLRTIDFLNNNFQLNIKLIVLIRNKKKKNFLKIFKNTKIDFVEGSITNFKFKKKKIDYVIHLAAETSAKKNKDYYEVINTIINGTVRLLEYSKMMQVKSFSYLSSGGVYGKDCKNVSGWNEDDRSAPNIYDEVATYGLSKKCSENILINAFKNINSLKTLNIFRAFSFGGAYFNKNNHFAYDNFIKQRIQKKNIELTTSGKSKRNYMHPLDLANWMLIGIRFNGINLINSGADKNYSIQALAEKIAKYKFNGLPTVRVKIGKQELKENYIPDLSTAKNLGLQAKISLDMQIEDSLNYYYAKDIKSSSI